MKLQLVVILALVFFLLIAIFAIVSQRRAMTTCQSDNDEMTKKIQEISFQLREAERIKEEGEDEVEFKVKEQEQTITDLKANFESSLNRKNDHVTQLTNQLRQTENANQMLMAEVQRLQAQMHHLMHGGGGGDQGAHQAPAAPPQAPHAPPQPPSGQSRQVPAAVIAPQAESQAAPAQGSSCDLTTGQCTVAPLAEPVASTTPEPVESITAQPTFAASMFSSAPPETVVADHSPPATQ